MIFQNRLLKKVLCSLFVLISGMIFRISVSYGQETSIINIESADKSEYKKDELSGGDCIILTGSVKISVSKGSSKTIISSDKVNYNRSTEMLFAEGNVCLEQTGGSSGGEKITADSLLFNTSTLEGIFDNGRAVQTSSDAINLPSGSTLIVASNVFGRDSGGTIAFKSGELTFCDDENPHWKIKASRIWLLPGGEFAFFNALLFVGKLPLMWFPAFYYPKDELIFNPAVGYKFREGYFINTTTYIYGRKPADAASTKTETSDSDEKIDLFSFMKTGSQKEQVREGLVLHNLDEDFKGDTVNHVKIMADYYSNLGFMLGTDAVIRPQKYISDFKFNLELGFSNTMFRPDNAYVPYNSSGDKVMDKSNFMSMELPFRYQANLQLSLSKPLNLTLSMPVYSDPFFDYDFNNRAETMDWIDFLMQGAAKEDTSDATVVSSFNWELKGSYNVTIPEFLKPYISTLSLSEFSSAIVYNSKSADLKDDSRYKKDSEWGSKTPERQFYYPSQITPFKASARISGTLFKYPFVENKTTTLTPQNISLLPPESLSEAEEKAENEEGKEASEGDDVEEEEIYFDENALPLIAAAVPGVQKLNGITYNLNYSISPDFTSQFSYSSNKLNKPEDFEWDTFLSTYIQVKAPATLTSTLGFKDSFLSLTDTFSFNPVYQSHPYINTNKEKGGYSKDQADSTKKQDYNSYKMDLTDTNSLSFRPFYYTKYFSNTSLSWNTTVKMIRTKYISDDVNNPEWEYLTTDLTDEDCVTTHNLNLVLAAKEGDYSQQLSLTSTLYPLVENYSGVFSLNFPYTSFSVSSGIKRKSSTDDTWVKQNISQSLSFHLFQNKLSLTQSYVYDLEKKQHDSFRFSASGYGAQLAYTMSYTTKYDFNETSGWEVQSDKAFQPYSLSLAYTSGTKNFKYWTDRVSFSPSLSTSVVYDFIRPTSSYFTFIPALTFKVNNFLNVTFSAESKNSAIYRYFCSDWAFNHYYKNNGYRYVWDDLIDSYRFDDEEKRKASNFKMQNFKILINHELCDWDFNCEWSVRPRLINNKYQFDPYFSLGVSWKPMAGMKTEIIDEYGEWSLK